MKSQHLSPHRKSELGKYKKNNPTVSIAEIARLHGVTYAQAQKAIKDYESGKLKNSRRRSSQTKIDNVKVESSVDDIINDQFKTALSQIKLDTKLNGAERIKLLNTVVETQKTMQSISLQGHLKRIDTEILSVIIRKFKPEITNEEIIQIYKEAIEELKK